MELTHILNRFKLIESRKSTIKFPIIWSFDERDMERLARFQVLPKLTNREDILNHFELEYELEYKYSMMKNSLFSGNPQRYENTLKLLEAKAREVIIPLAKTFMFVFAKWLSAHAITNPEQWAKARVENNYAFEEGDWLELLKSISFEFSKYSPSPGVRDYISLFYKALQKNIDSMPIIKDILERVSGEIKVDMAQNDLSDVESGDMDLEEWNQRYGVEATSVEDAYNFFDVIEADADALDYFEYSDTVDDDFNNIIDGNIPAYIELNKVLVFPVWFKYWKAQGIVETRARIEQAYKSLKTISKQPIDKQFMILSIVKNISHQTGDMMDYYENTFDVSKRALENLTKMDVTPFNKELLQMGVQLK